jgi:TonB family protein
MLLTALLVLSPVANAEAAGCAADTRAPVVVQSEFISGQSPLRRISGVPIHMVVDVDGKPRDIVVADPGMPATFQQAALKAAAKWRFDPALECGQAVARDVRLVVPVVRDDVDRNLAVRPRPALDPHQPGLRNPRIAR